MYADDEARNKGGTALTRRKWYVPQAMRKLEEKRKAERGREKAEKAEGD